MSYGLREHLEPVKQRLSDAIHSCVVDALQFPPDKRAHRFFHMDQATSITRPPRQRSTRSSEISMFEGRSIETRSS
jgi:hypothetical protein